MIKNFIKKNDIEYLENASLKNYNSFRIDCTCNYLVFVKEIKELINLIKFLKENKIKYLILGNGSNVIFKSSNYDGVVIQLSKLNNIILVDDTITVSAGYSLPKLAIETANLSLEGLEFAMGIPGFVGSSVAMNAGAYKKDMASVVKKVLVLTPDFELKEMTNSELEFSYRDSFLKRNKDYICLEVTLKLEKSDSKKLLEIIQDRKTRRFETQPLNYPSAGSVFRNPSDSIYAGKLIEDLGLKGKNIGDAYISEKHANFIVNKGNATGKDIIKLIGLIKRKVYEKYNIVLLLEQIIIE